MDERSGRSTTLEAALSLIHLSALRVLTSPAFAGEAHYVNRPCIPGVFLALLALVVQLAFGAVVPRPDVVLVLDDAGVICHAGAPSDRTPPAHPHRPPDCQFCPLCMSLATPGIVLPDAGPRPPPSRVAAIERPGLPPPAKAPPAPPLLAARSRGPPVLA